MGRKDSFNQTQSCKYIFVLIKKISFSNCVKKAVTSSMPHFLTEYIYKKSPSLFCKSYFDSFWQPYKPNTQFKCNPDIQISTSQCLISFRTFWTLNKVLIWFDSKVNTTFHIFRWVKVNSVTGIPIFQMFFVAIKNFKTRGNAIRYLVWKKTELVSNNTMVHYPNLDHNRTVQVCS